MKSGNKNRKIFSETYLLLFKIYSRFITAQIRSGKNYGNCSLNCQQKSAAEICAAVMSETSSISCITIDGVDIKEEPLSHFGAFNISNI